MDIELLERKQNALLQRTELRFRLLHPGEATPTRDAVREQLAAQLNAKKVQIVVDETHSRFGRGESEGTARVYDNLEALAATEPQYLIKRNKLQDSLPGKEKAAAASEGGES